MLPKPLISLIGITSDAMSILLTEVVFSFKGKKVVGSNGPLTPVWWGRFVWYYQKQSSSGCVEASRSNGVRDDCGSRQLCGKSHYSGALSPGLQGIRRCSVVLTEAEWVRRRRLKDSRRQGDSLRLMTPPHT